MNIAWKTEGSKAPASSVRYGFVPECLDTTIYGESSNYLDGHGFHHQATILDIPCEASKDDGHVYYQVGGELDGWSDIFSFKAAPCSNEGTIKVSVFGGKFPTIQRSNNFAFRLLL